MTDAHDGNDLTKVRARYGADGYAVYWYCLELIAGDLGQDEKITFELRHDAEVIAHNLKLDSVKVEEIMKYMVSIGLFEQSAGTITCLKLAKYLDKKTTRNSTIHNIIDSANRLSATLPDKSGHSGLDTDTDLDTEKPKPLVETHVSTAVPFEEILNLYHQSLPELPRCIKLTKQRKGYIRQRWQEDFPDLDSWETFFGYVRQSKFLMGKAPPRNGGEPFRATLDWLCKPENCVKVVEKKYG